jgi:hypothetical protein
MEETALQVANEGNSQKERTLSMKSSQVYYTNYNTVQAAEDIVYTQQYKQAWPSLAFGSQGIVLNVSQFDLSREIRVRLVLPPIPANVSLPKGWGMSLISQVRYRFGGSVEMFLDGPQMIMELLAESETAQKRSELLSAAGEEVSNGSGGQPVEANLFIPVPVMSRIRALSMPKPLDNSLLNQGYQIILFCNSPSVCMGGSAKAAWLAANNAYLSAEWLVSTARFSDPMVESIKMDLIKNPSLEYNLPFIYPQCVQYSFTGAVSPNRATITLNSFLNAELLAIRTICVADSDLNGDGTVGGVVNYIYNTEPGTNHQLLLNGQVLFDYPGQSSRLVQTMGSLDSAFMPTNVFTPLTQTASPFVSLPVKSYWTTYCFSSCDPKWWNGSTRLTGLRDIQNSTFQLSMSTATTGSYKLYVVYLYNSALSIKGNSASFIF